MKLLVRLPNVLLRPLCWVVVVLLVVASCEQPDMPTAWEDTNNGTEGGITQPPQEEMGGTGEGTAKAPYTVADVQDAGTGLYDEYGWVVGYVVGYTVRSMKNAAFTAEGAGQSNILIADRPDETDPENCMPIELKSADAKRSLSLLQNPEKLGRYVRLCGTFGRYFYVSGMREVDLYEWLPTPQQPEEEEPAPEPPIEEEPEENPEPSVPETPTPEPEEPVVPEPEIPTPDEPEEDDRETVDTDENEELIDGGRVKKETSSAKERRAL